MDSDPASGERVRKEHGIGGFSSLNWEKPASKMNNETKPKDKIHCTLHGAFGTVVEAQLRHTTWKPKPRRGKPQRRRQEDQTQDMNESPTSTATDSRLLSMPGHHRNGTFPTY